MANQTTSIDYKHPYASLLWQHRVAASPDGWQDATTLSGYVSGQGTKTLELSGATEAETGYLRCVVTNPAGNAVFSDEAALGALAIPAEITVGISNQTVSETQTAVFGPITVIGSPEPTIYWEAETASGTNNWQDADIVFGADGSGQGTDTYVIANTVPADNRDIRVTATNTQGFDVSQAALTVTPALAFVGLEPTDKTVKETVSGTPEYFIDFTLNDIGAWTHTRDSNATAPDASGTVITYTTDQPAWYRDQGLQLEDQSTNYTRYSEEFNLGLWIPDGVTVTQDGPAGPRGTSWTLTGINGDAGRHAIQGPTGDAEPDGTAKWRWMLKAGTTEWVQIFRGVSNEWQNVNLTTGALGFSSGTYEDFDVNPSPFGDGWWEVTETAQNVSEPATLHGRVAMLQGDTNALLPSYSSDGTDTIYIAYHQREVGLATSYMETQNATYTRTATSCTATLAELGDPLPAGGLASLSLQLVVNTTTAPENLSGFFICIRSGTTTNDRIQLEMVSDAIELRVYQGGSYVTSWTFSLAGLPAGELDMRVRIAEDATSTIKFWVNGAPANKLGGANFAEFVTLLDDVRFGDWFSSSPADAAYSKLRIVPEALTDEEIEDWS